MKHLEVRNMMIRAVAPLLAAGLAMMLWPAANALAPQNNAETYRTNLPTGTVIPVRLDEALSSKSASTGDTFTATVKRGSDDAGLPEGTRLEGRIREAVPSDGEQPGVLDVEFRRILFPGGSSQTITGSLYSLSGKAVKRTDGRLVATVDKGKDRLKFIGIGAGAGLLIGTLTKQNSILSLLLGAGAGYLYNEMGNKPKPGDVNLKEGQEFGVRLDRTLSFSAQMRRYYRQVGAQAPTVTDRTPVASADQIRVLVNDRAVSFNRSNRPYIRNGTVYLPLAVMGNAANFEYRYDAAKRMVYARGDEVSVGLGSKTATVDGTRRSLPSAAEVRNGVTFVPMQFVAWAANGEVGWDELSGTVTVTTNN